MIKWKRAYDEAKSKDELPPIISEYLGDCFMKIAQRLSFRPNFINYAFKDDMISDGIENCVQYIKNFNPEKSSNPFAYFTQIIYYAFIRRIQKEKKQLYIKYKTMESAPSLSENVEVSANDNDKGYNQETMNADQKANMFDLQNLLLSIHLVNVDSYVKHNIHKTKNQNGTVGSILHHIKNKRYLQISGKMYNSI